MKYTVACNWDPELLDRIDYPEVKSIFAGLPNSIISGGRSSVVIRSIKEDEIREYIKRAHEKGWSFEFNLNSACISNREITADGYKEAMEYVEWLCDMGTDSVTVTNTNLIEMIRKRFPQLRIKVSTYQKISSVAQAKHFEAMGVDAIMLSENVNRDFKLLENIRKAVRCKLILIANVGCVYYCPNTHSHLTSTAHSGAAGGVNSLFTETYHLYCLGKRLGNTDELVKIRWIRPEDVSLYEDIGIDMLKIIDRSASTDALAERVKAYSDRSYDGNLLNLLGQMMDIKHTDGNVKESMLDKVSSENAEKAIRFLNVFSYSLSDIYYLDNKKLGEDFLASYMNKDCRAVSCDQCGNCASFSRKAISVIDEKKLATTQKKLKEIRNGVMDGTLLY